MLLPPLQSRRGRRAASACEVRAGLHGLDSVGGPHLQVALEHAEAALYTLADAAVDLFCLIPCLMLAFRYLTFRVSCFVSYADFEHNKR
jgi:hypothetical protein